MPAAQDYSGYMDRWHWDSIEWWTKRGQSYVRQPGEAGIQDKGTETWNMTSWTSTSGKVEWEEHRWNKKIWNGEFHGSKPQLHSMVGSYSHNLQPALQQLLGWPGFPFTSINGLGLKIHCGFFLWAVRKATACRKKWGVTISDVPTATALWNSWTSAMGIGMVLKNLPFHLKIIEK